MQYPNGSILSAKKTELENFRTYEEAYHKLLTEMMHWQVNSLKLIAENSFPKKIFVDGGFSQNDVFLKLLQLEFPKTRIIPSDSPMGSAVGAAMVMKKIFLH